VAEKNHTLRVQCFEIKIDLCQKHDEVSRFDGTYIFNDGCQYLGNYLCVQDDEDDWETDPDYVNNMSEEQQR